jgi:integrase/recombinase XerD
MKFTAAVDDFIADATREGRLNSPHTITAYRGKLYLLAEDVSNRDPSKVGKNDIKRWLTRWPNPNSQVQAHAIARSFFEWAEQEGVSGDNPARKVRRAKPKEPQVARLTREETARFLNASMERRRDRWVAHLGCCAGLRSQELRGLQGRHFARPGFVWVSAEIGKGHKERWIPITTDLAPVVTEILTLVGIDEYVLPGQRSAGHPTPGILRDTKRPLSASALYKQVIALGERAGIAVPVTPHSMRHSFCTYVVRYAGISVARALMGHADISTTQKYTDAPTLDELAVLGARLLVLRRQAAQGGYLVSNTPDPRSTPAGLHNVRSSDEQSSSDITPREEVLSAEHAGRPEHTPDIEGVLVRVDAKNVTLTLEDGERLVFDATELRSLVA